jgi:hypothetical protein
VGGLSNLGLGIAQVGDHGTEELGLDVELNVLGV